MKMQIVVMPGMDGQGAGLRAGCVFVRSVRLLSSAITPVEIFSALSRKKREGDLSEEDFLATLGRIENERARWELIEVAEPVLNRAQEIVQGAVPVRVLDAIHIASCLTFEAAAAMRIPFITGDGRQRDAAAQTKLHIVWIG
jgi:predicted nucleic acid-binding protein